MHDVQYAGLADELVAAERARDAAGEVEAAVADRAVAVRVVGQAGLASVHDAVEVVVERDRDRLRDRSAREAEESGRREDGALHGVWMEMPAFFQSPVGRTATR